LQSITRPEISSIGISLDSNQYVLFSMSESWYLVIILQNSLFKTIALFLISSNFLSLNLCIKLQYWFFQLPFWFLNICSYFVNLLWLLYLIHLIQFNWFDYSVRVFINFELEILSSNVYLSFNVLEVLVYVVFCILL